MTKCGRYGLDSFDYSPKTIRESVKRSLERLKTDYLDTVYLHDVEFVCTPIAPRLMGNHTGAIKEEAASYGLAEGDEALIRGEGDQKVLDAVSELRDLQREGLIKNVGLTGKSQIFQCSSALSLSLFFFSLPTTYPFAPRYFDSPHASLQASRCVALVFSSLFAKLDFSRVYPSLLRTCEG
jgi:D-arabinose 1-dehydrogenase